MSQVSNPYETNTENNLVVTSYIDTRKFMLYAGEELAEGISKNLSLEEDFSVNIGIFEYNTISKDESTNSVSLTNVEDINNFLNNGIDLIEIFPEITNYDQNALLFTAGRNINLPILKIDLQENSKTITQSPIDYCLDLNFQFRISDSIRYIPEDEMELTIYLDENKIINDWLDHDSTVYQDYVLPFIEGQRSVLYKNSIDLYNPFSINRMYVEGYDLFYLKDDYDKQENYSSLIIETEMPALANQNLHSINDDKIEIGYIGIYATINIKHCKRFDESLLDEEYYIPEDSTEIKYLGYNYFQPIPITPGGMQMFVTLDSSNVNITSTNIADYNNLTTLLNFYVSKNTTIYYFYFYNNDEPGPTPTPGGGTTPGV